MAQSRVVSPGQNGQIRFDRAWCDGLYRQVCGLSKWFEVGSFIEVWKMVEVADLGKIKNLVQTVLTLKFLNISLASTDTQIWVFQAAVKTWILSAYKQL